MAYQFVEKDSYDGKIRRGGGSTNRSLKSLKHLSKIGNLMYVRGYLYKGRNGINHVGVIVRGDKGTVRFGGFSWGYGGTGARGLNQLFKALNLPEIACTNQLGEWIDFTDKYLGEAWRITVTHNIQRRFRWELNK